MDPRSSPLPTPLAALRRSRRLAAAAPTLAVGLLALVAITAQPAKPATAASASCPALPVTIVAEESADVRMACLGAQRAISFLADRGFVVERPITVEVAAAIAPIQGAAALGFYHAGTEVMKVLARSAFSLASAEDTVLGLPTTDDLYASVFAHEIAHAIFHQNVDGGREPSLAAHEYFAYTVQIATLPTPLRERVLARYPGSGFSHLGQVSEVFLGLDPQRFAVNAYLHFRGAEDQDAVLRRLSTLPSALDMY